MFLCFSDRKQPIASLELKKKTYKKSEASDCLWKWETRHKTELSQCTGKFSTADSKYSEWFPAFS